MLMRSTLKILRRFSKQITEKEIQQSNYKQLVDKMANIYGNHDYRSKSSISLLEMHSMYQIFKEGDRVLDVGAGRGGWTDIAIKYTRSKSTNPTVISVDKVAMPQIKGAVVIKGDITEKETKVEIVEQLKNEKLNTILCDVSPEYSGLLEIDSMKINRVVSELVDFGETFMHKGGTLIFKSLKSHDTKQFEKRIQIMFREMKIHKPTYMNIRSPVVYYVMKGFLINENFIALKQFKNQYHNSKRNRKQIIQEYKKYKFDPEQLVRQQLQYNIYVDLQNEVKEEDVLKKYQKDSFLHPEQYIEKFKKLRTVGMTGSQKQKLKAYSDFLGDQYDIPHMIPETEEELVDMMIQLKEMREAVVKDKISENDQLLNKDEEYMNFKQKTITDDLNYVPGDLELDDEQSQMSIDEMEIKKLKSMVPGFEQIMRKMESGEDLTQQDNILAGRQHENIDPALKRKREQAKMQQRLDDYEEADEYNQARQELYKETPNPKAEQHFKKTRSTRPKKKFQ